MRYKKINYPAVGFAMISIVGIAFFAWAGKVSELEIYKPDGNFNATVATQVTVTRDISGNMVFEDENSGPLTLTDMTGVSTGTSHSAATINNTAANYLTISGQEFITAKINLGTHVTGSLPEADVTGLTAALAAKAVKVNIVTTGNVTLGDGTGEIILNADGQNDLSLRVDGTNVLNISQNLVEINTGANKFIFPNANASAAGEVLRSTNGTGGVAWSTIAMGDLTNPSHNQTTNRSADDHTQYHNNSRGDIRYGNLTGDTFTGAMTMISTLAVGAVTSSDTITAVRFVGSAPNGSGDLITLGTVAAEKFSVSDTGVVTLNDTTTLPNDAGTTGQLLQVTVPGVASWETPDASSFLMARIAGSTFSTVQDLQNTFHSSGWLSGGGITDDGDGTITVAAGAGSIRATDSNTAEILFFDWSAEAGANVALTIGSNNYIYVEYNGGAPQVISTISERADFNTNVLLATVFRENSTVLHLAEPQRHTVNDHPNLMILRLKDTFPFAHVSGAMISEEGTRNIAVTAGSFWEGLTAFTTGAVDTSAAGTFDYYHSDPTTPSLFVKLSSRTQIDNLDYDDGSGTATLSNNRYGVHWVYVESDGGYIVVYGVGDYTLAQAEDAATLAAIPPRIQVDGRLIGKIIIQKSASTFTSIESFFDTEFQGSAPTDHESLINTPTSTAHNNYLRSDTADTMNGTLTMAAGTKILAADGSGAAPSISFASDPDLGFAFNDDDSMLFSANGVKLIFDTGGITPLGVALGNTASRWTSIWGNALTVTNDVAVGGDLSVTDIVAAGVQSFANITPEPSATAGQSKLFAKDIAGTSELIAMDGAGTTTTLSPHAGGPDWVYRSGNPYTGKQIRIDMERFMIALDVWYLAEHPGAESFVSITTGTIRSWEIGADRQEAEALRLWREDEANAIEVTLFSDALEFVAETEQVEQDVTEWQIDLGSGTKRQVTRRRSVAQVTGRSVLRLRENYRFDRQSGKVYRRPTETEARNSGPNFRPTKPKFID